MELILDKGLESELVLEAIDIGSYVEQDEDFIESVINKENFDKIKKAKYSNLFHSDQFVEKEICIIMINTGVSLIDEEEIEVYHLIFTTNENYFLTFEELEYCLNKIKEINELGGNREILDIYDQELQKIKIVSETTRQLNQICGLTMLAKEWIDPFAKWIGNRKVLEIGCGCGALSYNLKQRGVNLTAIDNQSWNNRGWHTDETLLWDKDIVVEDYFQVSKNYKDYDLYILAHPMTGEFPTNVVKRIKELNNKALIILIGPLADLDDDFFSFVEVINDDEEFNSFNSKYYYWTGHPMRKSKMMLLK